MLSDRVEGHTTGWKQHLGELIEFLRREAERAARPGAAPGA